MKKLFTLLALSGTFYLSAQIQVNEKSVDINGSKSGFEVTIPYGTEKIVSNALKDELTSWKGKYKSEKDYVFVDDCSIKEMGPNTFDAYAKVIAGKDGIGATVLVAIDLGGAYLNSGEHGAQAKIIQGRLQTFGVKAAKSAVDEEIKAEEDVLKQKQKELSDMESDQAKREKENEDYKNKIAENEKAIEESKKNQETKKTEIKDQETKVEEVKKKKEAIK